MAFTQQFWGKWDQQRRRYSLFVIPKIKRSIATKSYRKKIRIWSTHFNGVAAFQVCEPSMAPRRLNFFSRCQGTTLHLLLVCCLPHLSAPGRGFVLFGRLAAFV